MGPVSGELAQFAQRLRAHRQQMGAARVLVDRTEIVLARAPGRLDVMGGIADYSGSLVLQWPIRESTRVALQLQDSTELHIGSLSADGGLREIRVPLSLVNDAQPPYDALRGWCAERPDRRWAAYVAGVFAVLASEHRVRLPAGAGVFIESDVPEGKGISSSAAIEGATITAACGALGVTIDLRMQALICQRAENLVAGAPCGVMDQVATLSGEAGHLLALLCQPAELQGSIALPEGLAVFGIDSGIRHAVSGSDYGAVRTGAFMGYRVIADLAGLPVSPGARAGHVHVSDTRWGGYLANVGPDEFSTFDVNVPWTLGGSTFLAKYGGTTDLVTSVEADRTYAIWVPTAHPIYEHARVEEWARLLQASAGDGLDIAPRLGTLMYESHASYSACGLGSDGTDLLVQLAREAGPGQGIFGAKITGGGSGGTVAVLAARGSVSRVHELASEYRLRTGRDTYVVEGTSSGAAATGAMKIQS